jgi:hypothetical protein
MMNVSEQTRKYVSLGFIAIAIIAMIVLMAGYYKDKSASTDTSEENTPITAMKDKEDKVLVSISTETIQDGLANMGILITQEYYFTQVENYTKETKIFKFIPSESGFVYSYDGKVMAGIDFEKITISKDEDKKHLTVELPHSEIQATTIDKDTFKIYSEKDSLWNPIKLEDYNISLAEFEEAAKTKALENGILERSDDQAESLIRNFIGNFPQASGYDISFEWRDSNES